MLNSYCIKPRIVLPLTKSLQIHICCHQTNLLTSENDDNWFIGEAGQVIVKALILLLRLLNFANYDIVLCPL